MHALFAAWQFAGLTGLCINMCFLINTYLLKNNRNKQHYTNIIAIFNKIKNKKYMKQIFLI